MKKLLSFIILIAALLFAIPCFACLDPAEEARHVELKKMCAELKVPAPPEIFIRFQVHDKDGKLTFDDTQRGHSWTRNFWNYIFSVAGATGGGGVASFGAGYMSMKLTAGDLCKDAYLPKVNLGYTAGEGDAAYGIVVGTSDTAFSADHYALQALIAHGTGSGQLSYQAQAIGSIEYKSGTKTWEATLTRVYNNNSGGSITVKETGLYYGGALLFYNNSNIKMLNERTVLSPAAVVANGAQLTVTYTISMDFSAID